MALSAAMTLGIAPITTMAEVPIGISGEISAFENLPEAVAVQEVSIGATLLDITLPEVLKATFQTSSSAQNEETSEAVADASLTSLEEAEPDSPSVSIPVTWESNTEFNTEAEGVFVFTPQLATAYALAEDVELPSITVTVKSDLPVPVMATYRSVSNSSWQQVASDVMSGSAQSTSLFVVNGAPYVSAATGSQVKVWMVNGSSWEQLLTQSTTATYTSLYIDYTGRPCVAYSNPTTAANTKVLKFGTPWTSLGAPDLVNNQSVLRVSSPTLMMDENKTLYVAGNQNNMSGRVSVTKYNGSAWEYVGSPSAAGGQAFSASMDIDQNTLYIAYVYPDDSNAYRGSYVTMRTFDGSQWSAVGPQQISTLKSSYVTSGCVSMKVSDSGIPYVAYADPGTSDRLMVKKLSGNQWVSVGSYLTDGAVSYVSLYIDNETPYVAYKDGESSSSSGVTVKMFDDASGWTALGGSKIIGSSSVKGISLFVDDSTPYVSYSTNSSVKVMKYAAEPKVPVAISAGSASVTYAGADISLSDIDGLFTLDAGAGDRTYSIEAPDSASESDGEGQMSDDTSLTVTKAGIFKIGLETAESSTHMAGSKTVATLTVEKGIQAAPSGLGAGNASSSSASDGKITGLTSGIEYEYKLTGASAYSKVSADASGRIMNLPAGAYVVRYPETPLYSPSTDSAPITVGNEASLSYSAAFNTPSYTFAAATVNYTEQVEQEFTITNTGTATISGMSVSLDNASFAITSMVFVTHLAPNGSATVRVRPQSGLAAGIHTGTLTVRGSDGVSVSVALSFEVNKIQTLNYPAFGSYTYTMNSSYTYGNVLAFNMMTSFSYGTSNGRRVYTIEEGSTGQGTFNGSHLCFTSPGSYIVGLVTEETEVYAQTPKVSVILDIVKGVIPAPTIGAVNATVGSSNGAIRWLIAYKEVEYKIVGASSYTTATTDQYGQITGLPPGSYVVRYPENALHAVSDDSNIVTIGEDAVAYSATVTPASRTFPEAAYGYGQQQEQEFTIQNTGTSTITNLAASLSNGENFTISTPLSATQLAPNATATVRVQPSLGLPTGTYSDTLSVTGDNGISQTVSLTFTVNRGTIVNTGGSTNTKYKAAGINLSAVPGLFTADPNGGAPTYTIDSTGTTGSGTISGSILTVTDLGTFRIQLVTAETANYTESLPVTATLLVEKGDQDAPAGLTAVNVTPPSPVSGQITGLTPSARYEYRNVLTPDTGESYTPFYAGFSGEISGLSAGTYAVRYPATELFNASPVTTVTIRAIEASSGENSVLSSVVPANAAITASTVTATVAGSVTSQTIDVTVSGGAGWKLYGDAACTQEITNKTIALNTGANTAYIKVTAENGSTKIYTLTITRQNNPAIVNSDKDDDDRDTGKGNSSGSGSGDSGNISSVPVTGGSENKASVDSNGNTKATVTDKNIADAISNAKANAAKLGKNAGEITVVINVSMGGKDANTVSVNLPQTVQQKVINNQIAAVELTIDRPDIVMGLNNAAITEINRQAKMDVQLSATRTSSTMLSAAAKTAIGSRPVYNFKASYQSGNGSVTNFGKGTVYVSIPYTPAAGEKVGYLHVVYVDDKGIVRRVPDSAYDANTNSIIFATNHFSVYGVSYTDPTAKLTDISSHWAKDSIDYVVGRGLLSRTSEAAFSPDAAITRGALVTALGKLAGINEKSYQTNTFTDVKADSALRPYIEWAYSKGILQDIGNKQFAPDKVVTRQEAALIFANYAKATGYTLPDIRQAVFTDSSSIAASYKTAVTTLQKAGVAMGKTGNKFDPTASATRAEISSMLHRYVKLTIHSNTMQSWAKNDAGQWLYYQQGKALVGTHAIEGITYSFDTNGILKTGRAPEGAN
ncbi:S-layer homology domain-containing protein [Oscillospiraceae bacterium MB08-C2-2]|nr:S-layer homology domain-containing protein [Oscillospiraceae bacterium MB08-C2-2]